MTLQWRWKPVLLIAACMAMPACKARPKVQPVVSVRIFRDMSSPYAQQLDYRILEFQGANPRLSSGAAIQVGGLNVGETSSVLSNMDDPAVDIVILDSPEDAARFPSLQGEMAHAVNVCAAVLACPANVPALVPSKLGGEKAEAANKFVQYLATAKPEPRAPEPQPTLPQAAPPAQTGQPAQPSTGHP